MCQQGVMVCTLWYEGEENASLLEDFFSPAHSSTAGKAMGTELRHRNGTEAGQKARTKPSQLFLLPETDGNTQLACLVAVLESRAGTSGMEWWLERAPAWAPPHSELPPELCEGIHRKMSGSRGCVSPVPRRGLHRRISILKCAEKAVLRPASDTLQPCLFIYAERKSCQKDLL